MESENSGAARFSTRKKAFFFFFNHFNTKENFTNVSSQMLSSREMFYKVVLVFMRLFGLKKHCDSYSRKLVKGEAGTGHRL